MLFFTETLALKINKANQYIPAVAFARILDYPTDIANTPEKVENLLNSAVDWVFTVFLVVAVISLIYTAFMYLTSAGSQTKISKARVSLTVSIVAIVIALLAAGAPRLIRNLLEEGADSQTDVGDQRNPLNVDPNNTDIQPR